MVEPNTEHQSKPSEPVAPYVSFKTFQSGVQALRKHGLPDRIDRSVWLTKSGADQTALLSAFHFLGLVDSNGKTQPTLRKLADEEENSTGEKNILADVLRKSYENLFQLNLETLTPTQFAEAIGRYGPTGSTRERSMRFFVKAAGHCGIKMSGRLTARKPRSSGTKANGANAPRKGPDPKTPPTTPSAQGQQGAAAMKVIELPHAGGSLTLSGTFNPFELVGAERELVYSIIDWMQKFEARTDEATTKEAR